MRAVVSPLADSFGAAGAVAESPAAALLCRNLGRLAVRRNTLRLLQSLFSALAWGFGSASLMVLAYRFYLVDGEWWVPLIPILLSLTVGIVLGVRKREGDFAAALDADLVLGLRERLSSALAFVRPREIVRAKKTDSPGTLFSRWKLMFSSPVAMTFAPAASTGLVPALVQDASDRSAELRPGAVYPLKFDRTLKALLLAIVLFTGLCLMHNIDWFRSKEQKSATQKLVTEGQKLEALAARVQRKDLPRDEEAERLAKRLQKLAKKMQRGHMSRRAALTEMGQLRKELQKASSNRGESDNAGLRQAMEDLKQERMDSAEGKRLKQELEKGDVQKAAQQLDKMAEKLEKQQMSAAEKQQAAHDLQKAAKALRRQGGQKNEEAAQQLEQAAKSLAKSGQQQKTGSNKAQGGQGQQQGGAQSKQQQGNNAEGSGAGALRKLAQGLRQNGTSSGNSQSLRDMMKKIEEAEKNSGSNSGDQAGGQNQPKQGQAGGKGKEGETGSLTPGGDLLPSNPTQTGGGPGLGPRNRVQKHQAGGGVSTMKSKRTGDKRRWSDTWSDRLPKTRQQLDRITGKYGNDGEVEQLPTRSESQGGQVTTPYYQVPPSYKRDAEDAISKEVIPPAYKQPVRNYFDSFK